MVKLKLEYFEGKSGAVNCWTELVRFVMRRSNHTLPAIITGIIDLFDYPEDKFKEFIYMRERTKRHLKELLGNFSRTIFPGFKIGNSHSEFV